MISSLLLQLRQLSATHAVSSKDILASKMTRDQDPFVPKFRDWLHHLDAGEYIAGFIRAGPPIPKIAINI